VWDLVKKEESHLDLGTVTSFEVISSSDQYAPRATVGDVCWVPIVSDTGIRSCQRYLIADISTTFAISLDNKS
jgi:hypothetical protein